MSSASDLAQLEVGSVVSNDMISKGIWKMTVHSPQISSLALPGQFVQVRVSSGFKPFLRRPLSLGPCSNGEITLIYAVRGEGTRLLTTKSPGNALDLLGPLGQGFILPAPDNFPILVGGGVGIVPLLFLDFILNFSGRTREFLLGVRSAAALPVSEKDILKSGIKIAGEDGSIGFKGDVIQLLGKILSEAPKPRIIIYACGPNPMLAALKRLCIMRNLEAQVSLEAAMGCGVSACQSCAVVHADGAGYRLVCCDGPVFNIREVILD